jgi:hypothetical protein
MSTIEKTKPVEPKQMPSTESFRLELENKSIELKIGTHKFEILNILGANRGVEICLNNQEIWHYRYSLKDKTLYCTLTFEGALLHTIKTTHK